MTTKDPFNAVMKELIGKQYGPIRSTVSSDWNSLKKSSKAYYISKSCDAIKHALSCIAPGQVHTLLLDIVKSLSPQKLADKDLMMETIIQSYLLCNQSSTQIQILSIFVNSYSKEELKAFIPGLTIAKIDKARRHAFLSGPGCDVQSSKIYRDRLTMTKISHFLEFISTPSFCQIVGFGSKLIKMSGGVEIKIPKVVRTVISTRIIYLYTEFCKSSSFDKLSRATLFKF